jgi:hypothetical protein
MSWSQNNSWQCLKNPLLNGSLLVADFDNRGLDSIPGQSAWDFREQGDAIRF